MEKGRFFVLCLFFVILSSFCFGELPPVYNWMQEDKFDEIMDKMYSVNQYNCKSKPMDQLLLPAETVSELPAYNKLLTTTFFANRSSLLHLHNMALNRAFFFSLIYQRINGSYIKTDDKQKTLEGWQTGFETQPGLLYMYMSTAADVSGGLNMVNGSGVFFDRNCYYPNWYINVAFNETLPLFGPRAWRADDYNEPTHWLREPTNNTIDIHDYGTGFNKYDSPGQKKDAMFPWYTEWLPDLNNTFDSIRKYTYTVGIKYSNTTGKFLKDTFDGFQFFGPPQPGSQDKPELKTLPVTFTQPYFDCGKSNRWILTATSPIVDYMHRYVRWLVQRRPR